MNDNTFPYSIDAADVLFHSQRGTYGTVKSTTGEPLHYISYFAICAYPNDPQFYLFALDDNYEVIADWLTLSVDNCKEIAYEHDRRIRWTSASNIATSKAVKYITVLDTAIKAVNRGRQLNEASSIVYCGNDDKLHLIDFEACAINFKAIHGDASDNCIGERNIEQAYLVLYTSGVKTKITFEKCYVSNLFRHHLLTGTKASRFEALCSLIDETKYTICDRRK